MRFRVIAIFLGLAVVVAGCGTDDPSRAGAGAASESAQAVPSSSTTDAASTITTTEVPASATSTTGPPAAGAPATTAATMPATAAPTTVATMPATAAPTTVPPAAPPAGPATGKACIVSLHGKGGGGQSEWTGNDGVRHSFPSGNAPGWGGRQWLYYPASGYETARNIVANDVAAGKCQRVIVYGFSNGAAFAAKLYCRGETFGGTVVGYVIDDPVVDQAVLGCARAPVKVVLYWTGGINVPDGWECGDWTCEGGSTIGIARYETAVGVGRKQSIYRDHRQYVDPPELRSWF